MSLWNGIDTVAFVSKGLYSETYGVGEEANVANLWASKGLLEDAPDTTSTEGRSTQWFWGFFGPT